MPATKAHFEAAGKAAFLRTTEWFGIGGEPVET
jgi:hypothetical protein